MVDDPPDIDVIAAAKLAEMPVEEFVALNPAFSRPLIRASGAARIILPADKVEVFRRNLAASDGKSLVSWQIYHPRRGEKLATIAKKFRFSVAELKRVNGIPKWSSKVPRVMVVPLDDHEGDIGTPPVMYSAPVPRVHIVRRGDTLSSIAARYRVSVKSLRAWNRGNLGRYLQIGQQIRLGPR